MTIKRIDIISLSVSDQDRAKTFYTEILGFDLIRDNPMGPEQRWVQVGPKGAETSFTLVTWFDSMPAGGIKGIVLETGDIETTAAELKGRGLNLSEIERQPWGTFATFEDPDGNGFVLQQAVPDA